MGCRTMAYRSKVKKKSPHVVSEWVRPACQSRQPCQGAGKHNKLNLNFTFIRCQWTKENHRIGSSKKKCSGHVLASFQFACACRSAESSNPTCKQAVQLVERFLGTNSLQAQPIAPLASEKHSEQISNIVPNTWQTMILSHGAALVSRWSALLTHAAATAFAASLLFEDLSPHHNHDGDLPPLGHFLSHTSPPVPVSRLPAR